MASNSHIHFYLFVMCIVNKLKVFELKVFDIFDRLIELEEREWVRDPLELLLQRLNVV